MYFIVPIDKLMSVIVFWLQYSPVWTDSSRGYASDWAFHWWTMASSLIQHSETVSTITLPGLCDINL